MSLQESPHKVAFTAGGCGFASVAPTHLRSRALSPGRRAQARVSAHLSWPSRRHAGTISSGVSWKGCPHLCDRLLGSCPQPGGGGGEEHSSFLVGDEAAGPCRDPSPRALNQSVPTQPRFQVCPCCCCCCFGTGNAWGRAAGVGRETSDQRHNPMTCRRRTGLEHCQRERQALFGHSR